MPLDQPPVTIVDPTAPPSEDRPPEPRPAFPNRHRGLLALGVAALLAVTAAVLVRQQGFERGLDRAAERRVSVYVVQTLLSSNAVQLHSEGPDPVTVTGLSFDAPGFRSLVMDVPLRSSEHTDVRLVRAFSCSEAALDGRDVHAAVTVRTHRGTTVTKTVELDRTATRSLLEQLRQQCRYLPPTTAVTVRSSERQGRDWVVTLVNQSPADVTLTLPSGARVVVPAEGQARVTVPDGQLGCSLRDGYRPWYGVSARGRSRFGDGPVFLPLQAEEGSGDCPAVFRGRAGR